MAWPPVVASLHGKHCQHFRIGIDGPSPQPDGLAACESALISITPHSAHCTVSILLSHSLGVGALVLSKQNIHDSLNMYSYFFFEKQGPHLPNHHPKRHLGAYRRLPAMRPQPMKLGRSTLTVKLCGFNKPWGLELEFSMASLRVRCVWVASIKWQA